MKVLYVNNLVSPADFDRFVQSARESFGRVLAIENAPEPDVEKKQRTGCVVVLGNARGDLLAAIVLGELTAKEIAEYFGIAVEKMQRTAREKASNNVTSFQTAASQLRMYGGGVRDESSDTSIATSGLSAHGDECVSCESGYGMGRFSRNFVHEAMNKSNNPYDLSFAKRTSVMAI